MSERQRFLAASRGLLKATLPPALVHVLKERRRSYYRNFAAAKEASSGTWESDALTRFRVEEAMQNLPMLPSKALPSGYCLLLATMALLDSPSPRICDVGGGCGAWGYRLAKDINRPFLYDVVEHEGLVTACNAQPFFSWGRWSKELPLEWDVLICSGTLQCLERPYDLLRATLKRTMRYALVARTTFSEKDYVQVQSSILLHNGHLGAVPPGYDPGTRIYYPHRTVRLTEVLDIADAEGFDVLFKLHPAPTALAPGAFEQDLVFARRGC